MPAIGTIRIEGLKELDRKLKNLGPRVLRKVVRSASSKAMTPVLKDAKQRAKAIKDTGLLSKSLGRKTKTYTRTGTVTVNVGPRKGFKQEVTRRTKLPDGRVIVRKETANPANYAHLVELGTAPHSIGRRGTHPGTRPRPFLRPALDTNEYTVLAIYRRELAAGVIREAKKR